MNPKLVYVVETLFAKMGDKHNFFKSRGQKFDSYILQPYSAHVAVVNVISIDFSGACVRARACERRQRIRSRPNRFRAASTRTDESSINETFSVN